MYDFKIYFPAGCQTDDVLDDNIDVNIVLRDRRVFFATFFTIENVRTLTLTRKRSYFRAEDMVIIKDLKMDTIRKAVTEIVAEGYLEIVCSEINKWKGSFDSIIDVTLYNTPEN